MRNILILASAAALAAVTAAPATAADSATRTVGYSDLNLGKEAGVSALKQRVRSAAHSVCGTRDANDLASNARARACVDNALNGSNGAVDRAIQTARAS